MKKNKQVLLIGVLLGIISVIFLNIYIQSLKNVEDVDTAISYTDVYVAEVTIPKHTSLSIEMVKVVSIPTDAVHPDAVKSIDKINNGVTKVEITKDEQILADKLVTDGIKDNLAYRIPKGMRAITISVDDISGVGNYIINGDRIDILVTSDTDNNKASFSTTLKNIEVLEVGSNQDNKNFNEDGELTGFDSNYDFSSITILVSPKQAETVASISSNSNYHLILRNPMD